MNAVALGAELNGLLASTTRGMLCYVVDSTPYLTSKTFAIWAEIEAMAAAVAAHAVPLTEMLERLEIPKQPASFSTDVARFPYASLESLLPLLIDEAYRRVDVNERAVSLAADDDALHHPLALMLEENRSHLDKLQSFHVKLIVPDVVKSVEK